MFASENSIDELMITAENAIKDIDRILKEFKDDINKITDSSKSIDKEIEIIKIH